MLTSEFKKLALVICVVTSPCIGLHTAAAANTAPDSAQALAEQSLRQRVQDALHSDPYFFGAHVSVSIEKGNVVLKGIVFSDWDLRDALRIAGKAAGKTRVIDNLTIEEGGPR
jgi:osmotically-inducible protein OsmY